MLAEAEAAIVKRIEALLQPFEVTISPFPGETDKAPKAGRKGQIFIGYKRSRFRLTSMMPATLEVIAEYELSLMLKDLRSHTGAYPLLDAIRYAITGFIPLKGPSHKCYPVQEGFLKIEDGIWYYSMIVAVAMVQIEGQKFLYQAVDEDAIALEPGTVRPYDPAVPIQIQAGVRRVRIGNPEENVLDREVIISEQEPDLDFSDDDNSALIDLF